MRGAVWRVGFLATVALICAVSSAQAQLSFLDRFFGPSEPEKIEPHIAWRVENPFRLFENAADTELHREAWLGLSEEERKFPILSAERVLSATSDEGWARAVYNKTCWDSKRNRHRCKTRNYIKPEKHRVVVSVAGVEDLPQKTCVWSVMDKNKKLKKLASQSCDQDVVVAVSYPSGGQVHVSIDGGDTLKKKIAVKDLLIVGMGDSFASGEGNPDVPVKFEAKRAVRYGDDKPGVNFSFGGFPARVGGWQEIGDQKFRRGDARWMDRACHRSLYSHQLRAALQLAIEDPHRAVTFVGLSCSGAEITEGLFLRYKGHEWVKSPPDLSQISAAAVAQCGGNVAPLKEYPEAYHQRMRVPELENVLALRKCKRSKARKIDLLFVSIGGNDIGFSRLVANAVLADKSLLKRLGGWFGRVFRSAEAYAKLKSLKFRYKSLKSVAHNVLHIPWRQADRVILTGYPGMAFLSDGKAVCPDGRAGMEIVPAYKLSEKRVRAGVAVAEKLNADMRSHAKRNGWSFTDSHRPFFNGRGLCAGSDDRALNDSVDNLLLPRQVDGVWAPYNPADYKPYASRQRWFRTPNDAFMTGHFHLSQKNVPKSLRTNSLGLLQLLLASTYSGAFHPTAEGQAAIADALAGKARDVLVKYGQGRKDVANAVARQP